MDTENPEFWQYENSLGVRLFLLVSKIKKL